MHLSKKSSLTTNFVFNLDLQVEQQRKNQWIIKIFFLYHYNNYFNCENDRKIDN